MAGDTGSWEFQGLALVLSLAGWRWEADVAAQRSQLHLEGRGGWKINQVSSPWQPVLVQQTSRWALVGTLGLPASCQALDACNYRFSKSCTFYIPKIKPGARWLCRPGPCTHPLRALPAPKNPEFTQQPETLCVCVCW